MFGASPLTVLSIAWAAVTFVFLATLAFKSLVAMRESDIVILDDAESQQAINQQRVVATVQRLTFWAKTLGFVSLTLLLALGGVWGYRSYVAFNGG